MDKPIAGRQKLGASASQFTVSLTDSDLEEIDRICDERGLSRAAVIRDLLRPSIEGHRKEREQVPA